MKDYGAKIDGSLQEMKCSSPENLIGHPVTDIEEDHLHCWTPVDFIYDAGIVIWLIALCVVVKKRRIIQSIFWCCFGSSEKPPHALPWCHHTITDDVITEACCPETQLKCPEDRNRAVFITEFILWWIKCRNKIFISCKMQFIYCWPESVMARSSARPSVYVGWCDNCHLGSEVLDSELLKFRPVNLVLSPHLFNNCFFIPIQVVCYKR